MLGGGGLRASKEREEEGWRGRGQESFLSIPNPPHLGVLVAAQELSLGRSPLGLLRCWKPRVLLGSSIDPDPGCLRKNYVHVQVGNRVPRGLVGPVGKP